MADYESEFLGVSGGNSGQSLEGGTAQIKIVTLGIGGGGNNTIRRLLKVGVKGMEFLLTSNTSNPGGAVLRNEKEQTLFAKEEMTVASRPF